MARVSKKTLRERAAEVVRRLDELYPNAESELDYHDPFTLMIAVALSAQTTDVNVNKVTPVLFAKWPNAHALSGASLDEVEEVVHSLGFFRSKAKAIVGASQRLVAEYDGVVPDDIDELQTLPGVGRKTANIIMNQGFGKAVGIAVDTHVFRLAHRLGLTKAKTPDAVEKDLLDLIVEEDWGLVNHQLVLHGRRVCIARRPLCPECVLNDICPSSHLWADLAPKSEKS